MATSAVARRPSPGSTGPQSPQPAPGRLGRRALGGRIRRRVLPADPPVAARRSCRTCTRLVDRHGRRPGREPAVRRRRRRSCAAGSGSRRRRSRSSTSSPWSAGRSRSSTSTPCTDDSLVAVRPHDGRDGDGGDRLRGPARGRLPDRRSRSIYAVIRLTPAGGDVGPSRAALDSVYALILGGVITIIFTMLRSAAAAVDRAQQTALERYSHAVRQHAIEAERVQVDAIVHDSVLTTLLSAARAYTPEAKELAATMAGNAIGHLREAVAVGARLGCDGAGRRAGQPDLRGGQHDVAAVRRQLDAARARRAPHPGRRGDVLGGGAGDGQQPPARRIGGAPLGRGARARRTARSRCRSATTGPDSIRATVPTERLGVRVSIIERMSSAGGHAEIESAPGRGHDGDAALARRPVGGRAELRGVRERDRGR